MKVMVQKKRYSEVLKDFFYSCFYENQHDHKPVWELSSSLHTDQQLASHCYQSPLDIYLSEMTKNVLFVLRFYGPVNS